jgi:RNA polymerase sigma factor (sigma-70 family)
MAMSSVTPDPVSSPPAGRPPAASENRNVNRTGLTELVWATAEGDPESWDELVHRFTNLLWAIARSHGLNHDDAAEAVQNTWLRLLENLGRIDQPEALPGWLATTARREALDVLRRHARVIPVDGQDIHADDADAPEVDADVLTAEPDANLWACFQQLPERDKQLLRALVASDRPSYAAIAAALEMPAQSIGPTRMRALNRLRTVVETSDYAFRDGSGGQSAVIPAGLGIGSSRAGESQHTIPGFRGTDAQSASHDASGPPGDQKESRTVIGGKESQRTT